MSQNPNKQRGPGTIDVANLNNGTNGSSPPTSSSSPAAPKTPAEEGIQFFSGEVKPGEQPIRVYELFLEDDGGPGKDMQYIRLPPAYTPYILRVSIEAGTPAAKNGVFKTNFPLDGKTFGRSRFTEKKLPQDFSKPIQIDLPIAQAGAYKYWVEYEGTDGSRIKGREGFFNIDPVLRLKSRSRILSPSLSVLPPSEGGAVQDDYINLPQDGLSVLTVVSKWMGPLSEWHNHFQEAQERGYTMLHYPPLQERGESNSPYSIRNQLGYDKDLFGNGAPKDGKSAQHEVEKILKLAREEYGLLSLTDVVLNHTANDTPWLSEHPEAGFSPANTPHLTPALELDTAILEFSEKLETNGLPTVIKSDDDLIRITEAFEKTVRSLNLWQYYVLNAAREKESVKEALNSGQVIPWSGSLVANKTVEELAHILREEKGVIKGLSQYASRFGVHVEPGIAAGFIKAAFTHLSDNEALAEAWGRVVDVINVPLYEEWEADTRVAVESVKNRVKYTRLDEHGPKLGEISERQPLVEPYFTRVTPPQGKPADPQTYSLANNGWIWGADPLKNFALLPSKAYLRREVIVWGDCVKLRYGSRPSDNPWLWDYMTSYVQVLARTFDGFRIDNCHSTPLEVGTHMLDAARVVKPNLYVCAELFTGNEETDLVFVRELGINSLIRESYNGWDPKEYSRLLYRFGLGKPIGSMDAACLTSKAEIPSPTGKGPHREAIISPIKGSLPHALLYDLTHDNESPHDKRSAEDALSTGALAAFSMCGTGSVKGFDDLYPKLVDLVREKRKYELTGLGEHSGIAKIKRVVNGLKLEMVIDGFEEGHVHQENDYIVLHRVNPRTQKGYLLVAHTAFHKGKKDRGHIDPIKLRRTRAKYILGASISISSYTPSKDSTTLKGLPSTLVDIPSSSVPIHTSSDSSGPYSEIIVPQTFPPGSIMIFETQIEDFDADLEELCLQGAYESVKDLDLVDLNVILHRADVEEKDATDGKYGAYDVPGLGKMVYCGLEGWMHPLRHVMKWNDLGHPLCAHLREGTWAFDYLWQRLDAQVGTFPNLAKPAQWLKERCERVKSKVPTFMRPKYFALIVSEAYKAARLAVVEQCSDFVVSGHSFIQDLALCSVQMHGLVKSASLDPEVNTPSLAAGLPHFTTGWARCWGRDVFISLSGLFLTTGNFEGARRHILAFATTLKHGLIPNLLDSVRNPRYNSRDSPWWMLQNIQDYVKRAPDGLSILSETIKRRFPKDDTYVPWDDPLAYSQTSTIAEIIQEILERHAQGISFREHNAGPNLDMQMKPEGFDINVYVDWETGFVLGGSKHNCGTWMDKMGESVKAGTKGVPGSPRDGADVEIIGLLKSTLRWVSELSAKGQFPFKGVTAKVNGQDKFVTYKEWSDLIQASFEKYFYVPLDPAEDVKYKIDTKLVNRRGIYKDVYGSGADHAWADYQFRCNFPIAMTVAPEMFDPQHALGALKLADEVLRGPLGMKTLDAQDLQYRPVYDNQNDSDDASVAKGLNYHNGPEWGWPLGYFLRAYLHFDLIAGEGKTNPQQTLHKLYGKLLTPRHHIQKDPWRGLPELTNANAEYCRDSCPTQAWSASTLLDFLDDVHNLSL
ncbi:glycogen debranching enzyme [Coprinopsis cinerea AmutBmut pab1-1]|nr:glycogen debranching enzyme [Coprinopsis cinerea AmutBmut pab1-1]